VENLETTQVQVTDFVVESPSRVEAPRILDQLKKISGLKLDQFTQVSGAKFENTIKEMFSIIKDLEGHLRDVLTLNASLREDVQDKRKAKEELIREKEAVERKIAVLEHDFPRVQDLEKRLEITLEEVEKFRGLYRQEREKQEKAEAHNRTMTVLLNKVREERDDAYREIVALEDKLKSQTRTVE
jgi:chromosome segregation ATPase